MVIWALIQKQLKMLPIQVILNQRLDMIISKTLIYDIEDNLLINIKSDINPINHYLRSNKKYIYS